MQDMKGGFDKDIETLKNQIKALEIKKSIRQIKI
jgi:hypothetical protein